jgi:hypothetical protein
MAEYDKGRYYWIKLTDRFMSSDTVDFLMSQKDGANYVVLYQMLCLKTVNNNGVMARQLGEVIVPYEIEKIQRDFKWFTIDTVRVALELYKKLGLIFVNNDGILAIANFDRLIGSQTFGAEKKQLQRGVDKCPPICPPDKDKEKDKEIDKDKDKEINNTTTTNKEDTELKWRVVGSGYLFMSLAQVESLVELLTEEELKYYTQKMNSMLVEDYQFGCSHYNFILKMWKEDRKV